MTVYLDWNATGPRHRLVREAMDRAEESGWANPSSVHSAGRSARRIMEDARELLARRLRVSSRDLIFTGGGTEANHLALSGVRRLITSKIEHPSIVAQAEFLASRGAQVEFVEVGSGGYVEAEAIQAALERLIGAEEKQSLDPTLGGLSNENTPLVAVMAVNHETGVIQPIEEISKVVRSYGARLHLDAMQLFGKADLSMLDFVDSVAIAAHKLRGPKGVGVLAFGCGWNPVPLARGGAQERGLRPGTVDATLVAGLAAATERLEDSESAYRSVRGLRDRLETSLLDRGRDMVTLHGADSPRVGHVSNFRVSGWKGDELVAALDLKGICVSSGSACSAGSSEPSAVITAMLGRDAATGAVRVSFGEDSTEDDLRTLEVALGELGILKG